VIGALLTALPLASLESIIFRVANSLRIPVLVAALLALAWVLIECGSLVVELSKRRRRNPIVVAGATRAACEALENGDRPLAARHLAGLASNQAMRSVLTRVLAVAATPRADSNVVAMNLADFDLRSMRRLERTRVLVRAGPALGLMGTLIPLSPALQALGGGDLTLLTEKLRVAFSVTVLGLLIGVLAYAISLMRQRIYAQDLSVVEFVTAELEKATPVEALEALAAR
jgi:biopolymer transport protein ExbB/TolQ